MNEEAIKIWRDTFKLNLNQSRRRDIQATVKDLDLWRDVITNWGYWKEGKWIKFNPLAVGHQLSEYERRVSNANAGDGSEGRGRRVQDRVSAGVSERRTSEMPQVQQRASAGFRSRNKTLNEILAEAMQRLPETR